MKKLMDKIINKETISYLIFGILTTLVNLISYRLCTFIGIDYRGATIIAWVLAVVFAYITNKIYVFKSNSFDLKTLKQELSAFILCRLLSGAFDLIFMIAAVEIFSIDDFIAKIFTNFFVVILNYIASKFFIFKKRKENKREKEKSNLIFISFIIPVIVLIIIYIGRGIYPFGNNCYLPSDMYHQYAPFYMEMFQKIINRGSFFYSWNIGMGVNFIGLYAYYLSSPINWFLFLSPEGNIIETMSLLIIFKTGLSAATFAYYLKERFKSEHVSIAAFSLFYALSSYFSAYSWNIMWLDCLVLLPLIILGLEKLIKEGNCKLYCITLSLSILSNYYISIMICIFCVFYFFMLIFTDSQKRERGFYLRRLWAFTVFSILAGGMAAILLIPEFYVIKASASAKFDFPKTFTSYFTIFDIISRALMNVEASVLSGRYPNIYSTVAVFFMMPFYWMNKNVEFREKTGKTILIAILLVSFNMNVFNFIWHGLHFPNSLPARQSFIFIFLVLTMSFEGFIGIKNRSDNQVSSVFAGSIALFLMLEKFIVGDNYHFGTIYLNIAFLSFYLFLIFYYKKENYRPKLIIFLMFLLIMSEAGINTASTGIGTTSRTVYISDNKEISDALDYIENSDSGFYRIEKEDRRTNNDAAWNQYRGVSTFSSTANAGLNDLLNDLGFRSSMNSYSYAGYTPLTASLFSVKYMLHSKILDEPSDLIELKKQSDLVNVYENLYTLPLGFMLSNNFEENWKTSNSNPFRVQNSFAEALVGKGNLFESITSTSSGKSATLTLKKDNEKNIYIYISNSAVLDTVYVNKSPGSDYDSQDTLMSFKDLRHKHIINIGSGYPNSTIKIHTDSDEISNLYLSAYSFNKDVFLDIYNKLNENSYVIEKFDDTYIKGNIDSAYDGIMFTSIPYDKGWKAFVDGEETEIHPFKNAFLSVPVKEGKHMVEFVYYPEGFKMGMIISLLSLLVTIFAFIFYPKNSSTKDPTSI